MKNNFVLYITNFSTLEGSLITHQDLFENLNDNFELKNTTLELM